MRGALYLIVVRAETGRADDVPRDMRKKEARTRKRQARARKGSNSGTTSSSFLLFELEGPKVFVSIWRRRRLPAASAFHVRLFFFLLIISWNGSIFSSGSSRFRTVDKDTRRIARISGSAIRRSQA